MNVCETRTRRNAARTIEGVRVSYMPTMLEELPHEPVMLGETDTPAWAIHPHYTVRPIAECRHCGQLYTEESHA